MENIKPVIENIADDIKDYVETSITLYKHQATQKVQKLHRKRLLIC
ncbi:MAG: hypothetical protein IPK08_08585 [Bacteroidetes bacterium]|nr:hypothetical protein [Bacteroidota bacterium]